MYKSGVNALLIDDDDIYRYVARKMLELTGYVDTITVCADGGEGINFLEDNQHNPDLLPDIIFLDLNMPVMNGWQFLDKYSVLETNLPKQISLYIVTSSLDCTDFEYSQLYHCVNGFITKPFVPEKISKIFATVPVAKGVQ